MQLGTFLVSLDVTNNAARAITDGGSFHRPVINLNLKGDEHVSLYIKEKAYMRHRPKLVKKLWLLIWANEKSRTKLIKYLSPADSYLHGSVLPSVTASVKPFCSVPSG